MLSQLVSGVSSIYEDIYKDSYKVESNIIEDEGVLVALSKNKEKIVFLYEKCLNFELFKRNEEKLEYLKKMYNLAMKTCKSTVKDFNIVLATFWWSIKVIDDMIILGGLFDADVITDEAILEVFSIVGSTIKDNLA